MTRPSAQAVHRNEIRNTLRGCAGYSEVAFDIAVSIWPARLRMDSTAPDDEDRRNSCPPVNWRTATCNRPETSVEPIAEQYRP